MRYLLALILLLTAPLALADLVLRNKETGTELRLLETPCSHGETLAALAPEWRGKFKNARILNAKGHIEAYGCWIQHDESTVAVILEDGSMMGIASARFADPAI